ncbi:glycosyltransferase family 1 protein [Bacillus sp. 1P02SD]|uniref:glycosyltransferase family 1 protein n=1 Tax=Bacillus sp. 1P02SD TaxID=3132264 RepID=UPI00399FC165
MKKIKVLHVLGGLWCGGTETFVMSLFRNIDREKFEFIFLIHEEEKAHYDDEVLALGGKIYRIKGRKEVGILNYIITLVKVLKEINPHVIHSHAMFNSGVVMFAAYLAGIKKRVSHAHSSKDEGGNQYVRIAFQSIMRFNINLFSTDHLACNVKAGEFLFRKNVPIINNGLDLEKFTRKNVKHLHFIRNELSISEDMYVIGFVGRLVEVKNPVFIINILEKVLENKKNSIVVIVGDGPLKDDLKSLLELKGLTKFVKFTGNRSDVASIMDVFDVLVLPSLFEGMPIVALEAQAKGLPCVLSNNIPRAVDLGLDLIKFIPLNNEEKWISAITENNQKLNDYIKIKDAFMSKGYDIQSVSAQMLKIYGILN